MVAFDVAVAFEVAVAFDVVHPPHVDDRLSAVGVDRGDQTSASVGWRRSTVFALGALAAGC